MTTKRKDLSDLQRDLLQLALHGRKGKIWLPKSYQQSFPTTYAAITSLQRRGLLEAEHAKDPEILSWHVTKDGREALKTPQAEPSRRESPPPLATAAGRPGKTPVPPAAKQPHRPAPAPLTAARSHSAKDKAAAANPERSVRAAPVAAGSRDKGSRGKEPVPAKSSRSPRPAPAASAKAEAPGERGPKGKTAAPAANASRGAGKKTVSTASKKAAPAAKKSGGRGRT